MKTILTKINELLSGFTGWLMLAMMLILVTDILWRLFGEPLQGMAEMSVFVMMIVIYLGFARCEEHHDHVALEFFTDALPNRARSISLMISQILAVVTVGLLLYAVTANAWSSFVSNEAIAGTVEVPIWPTKFVMVVGMIFFFAQVIANIFNLPDREDVEEPHGDYE